MERFIVVIAIIMLLIAALACESNDLAIEQAQTPLENSGKQPAEEGEDQQSSEPETLPEQEPELPPIQIIPLSVIDPATPSSIATIEEGYRLVGVEIVIVNNGDEPISINPLYMSIQDADGFLYDAELAASDEYSQIETLTLLPNERIHGHIFFQVDEEAEVDLLQYQPNLFEAGGFTADLADANPDMTFELVSFDVETKLGETAPAEGVELTVLSIADPANPGFLYDPDEGTRLVGVEVQIKNIEAGASVNVNPLYFYLVDDHGFVHAAELGALADFEQIDTRAINAGQAVKGYIAFQLPEGYKPAYIRFMLGIFGDEAIIAGLMQ